MEHDIMASVLECSIKRDPSLNTLRALIKGQPWHLFKDNSYEKFIVKSLLASNLHPTDVMTLLSEPYSTFGWSRYSYLDEETKGEVKEYLNKTHTYGAANSPKEVTNFGKIIKSGDAVAVHTALEFGAEVTKVTSLGSALDIAYRLQDGPLKTTSLALIIDLLERSGGVRTRTDRLSTARTPLPTAPEGSAGIGAGGVGIA